MKKFLSSVNNKVKHLNVFSSAVNLRHEMEPQYKTPAGGYISVGLVILLSVLFYGQWISLINKNQITTTTQTIREFDPSSFTINTADFMFAVGVTGINMSDVATPRYFDFSMAIFTSVNGVPTKTDVALQTCTQQHWVQLGQQFVDTYKRWKLSGFLCPQKNSLITISGKYTSQTFIYYKISISKCTGLNCRTPTQLNNYISTRTYFTLNFYYSNSLLNPDQTTPVTMYFQDKDYLTFSNVFASMMNLYIGQYHMTTDQNLMPWKDQQQKTGFIINTGQKQVFNYIPQSADPYCKVYIRKSNIKYNITRSFLKIDQVLSYIGGLFGIIAVAIGFIMNYYGQCSFQLQMSNHIFQFNKTNKQSKNEKIQNDTEIFNSEGKEVNKKEQQQVLTPSEFGFGDFIVHLIYSSIKSICPSLRWKRMELYQQSLQEIRNKLQVSHLLQKLSFYDRAFAVLFDEHQLKLLYLQEKLDFQQVRQERTMLNLKALLISNCFQMNQQNDNIQEQDVKKDLDVRKSTKRIKTFIGNSVKFMEDIIQKDENNNKKLPVDIIISLQKLQKKIQQGDKISIRIYNGLKYQFLEAYENRKKQKNKSTHKEGRRRRLQIKQTKQISFKDLVEPSSIRNFMD